MGGVNMMEAKLANLERALAMASQFPQYVPVQVFPHGVDRAQMAPKMSVI